MDGRPPLNIERKVSKAHFRGCSSITTNQLVELLEVGVNNPFKRLSKLASYTLARKGNVVANGSKRNQAHENSNNIHSAN